MRLRGLKAVLSIGMASCLFMLSTGHTALASTSSNYQSKINNLAKKANQAKNNVSQLNKNISQNQSQQKSLQQQLTDLQHQIDIETANINKKQSDINLTKKDIQALQTQISDVKSRIAKRDTLLKQRVKAMYETGGDSALQLLLSSQNFGQLASRIFALNTIMTNDQTILDKQMKDKKTLDQKESDVQIKLTSLNKDLTQMNAMNQSLSKQKSTEQTLLTKLKAQAKTLEQEKFSQQEIAINLEKQKVAAQKAYDLWKQEQANKSNSSSSNSQVSNTGFIWPIVGGYNHITSPYGYRTFLNEFHHGIDIGVPEMTPIHAAADGVVARAYPSSSYGNVIFLTSYVNGKKYTTVYAHENHYIVHTGDTVHQGQVIGYVGHTGQAFGSHLHFAVYVGDWTPPPHPNTIDPMKVLPAR